MLALFVALVALAPPDVPADTVDAFVTTQMTKQHIPGCSIAIVKNGEIALVRGYGLASEELQAPATADTVYEIGSMTKQFTAAAIMMLAEQGKLALSDPLSKFLKDIPETWKPITLRQLLNHTSGIKNYTEVGSFLALARNPHTATEIVKLVRDAPLEFTPGSRFSYSNTGYYLLGLVIEKASGQSYMSFLTERILTPLGMTATRDSDPAAVIPHRSCGYSWLGSLNNRPLIQPSAAFSAGELVSTVGDLAKWDAALCSNRILPQAQLKRMWTSGKTTAGQPTGYGFGWAVGKINGHTLVEHGGGTAAFSTIISRFPDDKLTVIVLTNLADASTPAIAHGIASLIDPALAPPKPAGTDPDPKRTARILAIWKAVQAGNAGMNDFTVQARNELAPHMKEAAAQLSALGPVKSFTFVSSKQVTGGGVAVTYRAEHQNATLNVIAVVMSNGQLAALVGRPE
jgi:CubicO group peptidase (beta-lactamase class C family)